MRHFEEKQWTVLWDGVEPRLEAGIRIVICTYYSSSAMFWHQHINVFKHRQSCEGSSVVTSGGSRSTPQGARRRDEYGATAREKCKANSTPVRESWWSFLDERQREEVVRFKRKRWSLYSSWGWHLSKTLFFIAFLKMQFCTHTMRKKMTGGFGFKFKNEKILERERRESEREREKIFIILSKRSCW